MIGLFLAIVADIRPKNRLKHKLFKDFRNIDRYGLRNEEKEEQIDIVKPKHTKAGKGKTKTGPLGKGEELKEDIFGVDEKKP